MSTENTYTIAGNLTADPELGFTGTGSMYARFSIAHTPRRLDRTTGEWVDGEPLFMRCVAWRDLADHIAESLRKGQRVIATGQLRQSNWTTDTGEKRSSIDLHVDEMGPSLRFATAKVVKAARSDQPAPADPWATGTPTPATTPAPAAAAASTGGVPGFTDTAVEAGTAAEAPPF